MEDFIIINGVKYKRVDEPAPDAGFDPKGKINDDELQKAVYGIFGLGSKCDKLCESYAKAVKLFLELSRWQALNDKPVRGDSKYYIDVDIDGKLCSIGHCGTPNMFGIYFSSREKAYEAIDVFREELRDYFDNFKPRLDM